MKIRGIFAVCLVLAAAGVSSAKAGETEYYAVLMNGKKIGYMIRNRVAADGNVTTTEETYMKIIRADAPAEMRTTETEIETADGKPLGFKVVQDLGAKSVTFSGTVDELWIVNATAASMGQEQKKSFGWPNGAVMAEGMRLMQLEKGFQEGLEYNIKRFDPSRMGAMELKIRIGPEQNVDLLGRAVSLTEVKTTIKVQNGGEIASTDYVDKDFHIKKTVMPLMGTQQMEMIACTKEFALGKNDAMEMVDKMFLASPEPLDNIESAKSTAYYLKPNSSETKLAIPSSDNQSVELKDGVIIVTVRPIAASAGAEFPYEGKDSNAVEAMKPTSFIQSDYNDIIALAKRAVGETKDAAEAVKKIESFVSGYIEKRNLSVGYASAEEVAASKTGDCTEFAVLTAAMCRAAGIPARVVSGLVYTKSFAGQENVFGGHMWVEAYVGDKWIGLDATRMPKGFDAGHIALAIGNGEPTDFLNLATTLGQFKIDKVVIER